MTTTLLTPQSQASVDFLDIFDAELAEHPDKTWTISGRSTLAWPKGEDEAWWRKHGPEMVRRWLEWREKFTWPVWITPDGVPAIELGVEVTLDGEVLRHFVDIIFATGEDNTRPLAVDVKSGAKPPDNTLQLGMYKVAVEAKYPGVKIIGGAYWLARKGELTPIHNLHQYTPTYIAHLAHQVSLARDSGIFLPRQSNLCRSCKVGAYCAVNGGSQASVDPDSALMG